MELVRANPRPLAVRPEELRAIWRTFFQNRNGKFLQLVEIGIIMTSDRKEWSAGST